MSQRIISVGFIRPELKLGDNTIYINLAQGKKYDGWLREPAFAEAISSTDFDAYLLDKNSVWTFKRVSNVQSGLPIGKFIDSIEDYNDGKVDYIRALREGAGAFGLIKEIVDKNPFAFDGELIRYIKYK